jgi:gliding motility-associated-like protein
MQTIHLRKISFTVTLFLAIFFSNNIQASIIYVDSAATGLNNGSSWTDAYTDFQAGVTAANAGDTVWVAKGTYQPALDSSFSMKNGVKIYGGFAGTETSFAQRNLSLGDSSILKGNGYRIITNNNLSNSAVLDGFTITGGSVIGTPGSGFTIPGGDAFGGGMYNNNASPTLSNLIFSNNQVTGGPGSIILTNGGQGCGAGMYDSNSSPILSNVIFKNNIAIGGTTNGGQGNGGNGFGAGMYNINASPILNNVTFSYNSANGNNSGGVGGYGGLGEGGGMFNYNSSPQLTNVNFQSDSAKGGTGININSGNGGGMYNKSNSIANLNTVYFYNNGATGGTSSRQDVGSTAGGGGIYNDTSSAILRNVIFSGNTAKGGDGGWGYGMGGGMYNSACSPGLTNVQFLNNNAIAGFADISTAEGDGGGIYNNASSPNLTNVIFSGNWAHGSEGAEGSGYGGGMYNTSSSPMLMNVAFSNNSATGASFVDFMVPSGGYGGGIYNKGSSPKLINITFFKNAAVGINFSYGGGIYNANASSAIITNSVFWADTAKTAGNDIDNISSTPLVTYSFTQTAIAGAGNIQGALDPFADTAHPAGIDGIFMTADDGLHIVAASAAFNSGRNDSIPAGTTTDITGTTARILDSIVEMGAYETKLSVAPVITSFTPTGICGIDTVVISGHNFEGDPSISFGGIPVSFSTVVNDSTIKALSGNGASGNITITTSGGTATTGGYIYVAPSPSSVSIAANSADTICAGTNVTFTATSTNGGTPSYQWKLNGVNVGSNSSTYNNNSLSNIDTVYCIMTNTTGCVSPIVAISDSIIITVRPIGIASISILASADTICNGSTVTFTATTTNGGFLPSYQWQVDGINVGTDSSGFTTNALSNGNSIKCIVTSSAVCTSNSTDTSNNIVITVNSTVIPSTNITSSANNICSGSAVTFTAATTNGGSNPSYQWQVNGINAGTDSSGFTTSSLANGNSIKCIVTGNASCSSNLTDTSNAITIAVNPTVIPSTNITSSSNNICSGAAVTFTATTTNGGSNPSYQWQVNGVNAGTDSSGFTTNALTDGNIIKCIVTGNATCSSNLTDTSNAITITVNPTGILSTNITSSANNICSGSAVTLTAAATNGGSSPSYQWQVNGANAGADSSGFTTNALSNGNSIKCIVTSNAVCTSNATDTSNNIVITVNPTVTPSVTITADTNNICYGTPVIFTATVINGGNTPSYQWKINGNNTGTNDSVYTGNNLQNGDIISCLFTSNLGCASSAVSNNNITMGVYPLPSVTSGTDTIQSGANVTLNLLTTGSIAYYMWTPADSLSNDTTANPTASPRINTTYTLQVTTVNGCTASGEMTVTILPPIISIPNAFTPNGDGYNDTWHVYDMGGAITSVDVYVYTTNGALVYQATNYQNTWDGTYNGKPLPDGTYFYYITLHFPDHSSTIRGNVTIIR